MTQDEIIRMAREADVFTGDPFGITMTPELERFAALVAAHEREACAKVCDEWYEKRGLYGVDALARVIRARGDK